MTSFIAQKEVQPEKIAKYTGEEFQTVAILATMFLFMLSSKSPLTIEDLIKNLRII